MTLTRTLTLAVALMSASQAAALSCLRPDPARAFMEAQQSEDRYVGVLGSFAFDPARLPKSETSPNPADRRVEVPATFTGKSLTLTGYDRPISVDVTLEVSCLGPWCGGLPEGRETLTFLRLADDGYRLAVQPCVSNTFVDPDRAMQATMLSCLRGETCAATE